MFQRQNMFQRQWFPLKSQIGLCNEPLNFENLLNTHQYEKCREIINNNLNSDKEYWGRMRNRLIHLIDRNKNYKIHGKKPNIYIFWHGFWPKFNVDDNQILDFLKSSSPNQKFKSTTRPKQADIFLTSCLGREKIDKKFNHCFRIIFIGENVRPYFRNYDLSLSSDLNNYRSRNIYLPLWMFEIDLFNRNDNYPDRVVYNYEDFCDSKIIDYSKRKKGIVFVGNNEEPFRQSLINELKEITKEFYTYGTLTNPVEDKIELLRSFQGNLAIENSFFPGYITEKAMHGYISGAKTLYWGCSENSFIQNNPLFINISSSIKRDDLENISNQILNLSGKEFIPPLLDKNLIIEEKDKILKNLNINLNQFKII